MNYLMSCAVILTLSSSVYAESCPITPKNVSVDIQKLKAVKSVQMTSYAFFDSDEPTNLYSIVMVSGDTWLVEQRHCEMRNLSVTVLGANNRQAKQLLAPLNNLLGVFPTWNTFFDASLDPKSAIEAKLASTKYLNGSWNMEKSISAENEYSEVALEYKSFTGSYLPLSSVITLGVSIGGE